VRVVQDHKLDTRPPEHRGHVRLPNALGQPHAAGTHAEVRAQELAERLDLAHRVLVGKHGQDGPVEAARQQLDAAVVDELAQGIEGIPGPLANEGQEAA